MGTATEIIAKAGIAIYIAEYIMEAVGFSEFIYEESVQTGIAVLRMAQKKKMFDHLPYLTRKFEENIFSKAYAFHLQYGFLNPFTYDAFHCFYRKAYSDYNLIYTPTDGYPGDRPPRPP